MNRKQYGLILILVVIAGILGGVVSGRLFTGKGKVVAAEKFLLVDESGMERAALMKKDGSTILVLRGRDGRERAVLAVLTDGSPAFDLLDAGGKSIFYAP